MMTRRCIVVLQTVLLIVMAGGSALSAPQGRPLPTLKDSVTGASGLDSVREAANTLRLGAPISPKHWDDALPLGNGLLGGLLFGEGSKITLGLDRGDIWDEQDAPQTLEEDFTYKNMLNLVNQWREGNREAQQEWSRLFNTPYKHPTPTKLPGGILTINLDDECKASEFILDCSRAVGTVVFADGKGKIECFYSAVEPVALMRITGAKTCDYDFTIGSLVNLGYSPPTKGDNDGVTWVTHQSPDKRRTMWLSGHRKQGDATLIAVTISLDTTGGSEEEQLNENVQLISNTLDKGWERMIRPHQAWWDSFWATSDLKIPDELIMRNYTLVRYLLGSGSRLGAPPMPLQGVWTSPGRMPPWKGDYHHDLNTQMTYLSYLAAGHLDEGRSFFEFMWDLLPVFREFTRDFHDAPGIVFPSVMSQGGKPLCGWPQYCLLPAGNCSWVGWMFYRHWLYTRDREFLAERAYPFCKELGTGIEAMLTPDEKGFLRLDLSSSPEVSNAGLNAYLPPNSNYDHDSMVAMFSGLAHMADELGKEDEAARWRRIVAGLGERYVDEQTKALGLAPGRSAGGAHRHLSHVMSIHPYGALNIEGDNTDRETIRASLDVLEEAKGQGWTGYSYSWASCVAARAGDPEAALKYLTHYCEEHTTRNGFHSNWSRKTRGQTPFTLEGNFMSMEAVHEMLLQSWGGTIRVFPALPDEWKEASFRGLRAEGGFAVSASRKNGTTQWVEVKSLAGTPCQIKPGLVGEVRMASSVEDLKLEPIGDGRYALDLRKGDEVTLYVGEKPAP